MMHHTPTNTTSSPYRVGDIVPESNFYICVPCGYRKYLRTGRRFPSCVACLGKDEEIIKGLELWEKIDEI